MRGELLVTLRGRLRELTGAEARILLALVTFASSDGACWPSARTLAATAGLTVRYAKRLLRRLQDKGFIHRSRDSVGARKLTVTKVVATTATTQPDRWPLRPPGGGHHGHPSGGHHGHPWNCPRN